MRVPEGKSSGLPMANRAGCPYVARGLMKTRLLTAESTAEPNRPTLVSHASTFRRGIGASVLATAITLLLGIHQLFQIAPEDLILGVFEVVKIVLFYGKDKDAHRGQRHREAAQNGNPGQFHRASSIPTMMGRRAMAACCARNEMVAPLSTSTRSEEHTSELQSLR